MEKHEQKTEPVLAAPRSVDTQVKEAVTAYIEASFVSYQRADEDGDRLVATLEALYEEHGQEILAAAIRAAVPKHWETQGHRALFVDADRLIEVMAEWVARHEG